MSARQAIVVRCDWCGTYAYVTASPRRGAPPLSPESQAAEELDISPRAVLHRIKTGTLQATRLGDRQTSAWAIDAAEIERAKAEQAKAEAVTS